MNQTIKPCVLAIVLLFAGWPAWAQTNLLGDIQTERAKYPVSMTPVQVAAMLNQVAWNHRAEGWGLLKKGAGNSCPLAGTFISCDILIHAPSGQHWDVLQDAENTARPQFNLVGPCVLSDSSGCSMANFMAPVDPGGPAPQPVPNPQPVPVPVPVPAPVDLSRVYLQLDGLYAQAERMFQDDAAREAATLADLQAQIQAVDARLAKHDEQPTWLGKLVRNPAFYAIVGPLVTYFTTRQMTNQPAPSTP